MHHIQIVTTLNCKYLECNVAINKLKVKMFSCTTFFIFIVRHLFAPEGFKDRAFKAPQTNIGVSYIERGGGGNFSIAPRNTASVSLSLSLYLNIVVQSGQGGSGRGDGRRETDGGGPGETKPVVRGSDSGEREGQKTSKHYVGDRNCGLVGCCCCCYQTWPEYDIFRAQSTKQTCCHPTKFALNHRMPWNLYNV